jgi:hypothetical protein
LATGTPASTGVSRKRSPDRSPANLLAISTGDRAGVNSLRTVASVLTAARIDHGPGYTVGRRIFQKLVRHVTEESHGDLNP